jgi:thioredoxin 1
MKNTIVRGIILFFLAGLMPMSCGAANTKADESSKNAAEVETYLVTFVELGSVRCVPCKMMQPIMKDIEKDYAGQVKVVFHDVWTPEGEPFATSFKIRVIPTQVFLDKDSKEYFRHEGFFPKEDLIGILKQKGVK